LARAHAVLGSNEMEYDWDFAGGEAEYKKALELDPNDAYGTSMVRNRHRIHRRQGAGGPCGN
jgi:hypothetical protein